MSERRSYTLGIESAIGGGSVSLHRNGVEIDGISGDGSISRAEELLPRIDELLRHNGISIRDTDVIIVSSGPGSYTGIRVGIATVLGLRASTNARCRGVSILQAMTLLAGGETSTLTAVPMGRNMVCSQLFEHEQPTSLPSLNTTEEFITSAINFAGKVVMHGSLFDEVKSPSSPRLINAGVNLASLVAAAAKSEFASDELTPLFVDRQ